MKYKEQWQKWCKWAKHINHIQRETNLLNEKGLVSISDTPPFFRTTGYKLMYHDSGNTIKFSFFTMHFFPIYPENHDSII